MKIETKIVIEKGFLGRLMDKLYGELFIDSDIKSGIKGVIFGQAIGDALGLGTEFMSRDEVVSNYPNGLSDYSQIIQDPHRRRWIPGEWTDDTDMLLCIANAMLEKQGIKLDAIAHNFKKWFKENPRGVGRHTYKVLSIADYEKNPMRAAEMVWELSNKNSAANGALMRTSIVGLCEKKVATHAENICRLTHADPRCVGSCVIVSELIHHWVWHKEELTFDEIVKIGRKYDKRIEPYLRLAREGQIEDLTLDNEAMGYTLKTLSAAIWCLYHVDSFEEGLLTVVNAGGDADTNAAVACSLLGAKYGYSTIPERYIKGLCHKGLLDEISERLFKLFLDD